MGRCEQIESDQIDSSNVFYSGPYLPTLNIQTDSNLTLVLSAIESWASGFSGGSNNYTIKGGINTQTADGLTLVFNIPHTLGQVPTTYSVEPTNQSTANNFSITTTLTNLVITYPVAPSQGTNLSWAWQVIKT